MYAAQCHWLFYPFQPHFFVTSDVCVAMPLVVFSFEPHLFLNVGCLRGNVADVFNPFQPHLFLNVGCLRGNVAGCYIHFSPISSLTSDVCAVMSLVVLSISTSSLPYRRMFAGQCCWLFYPFQPHLFLNVGCLRRNVAGCFIHFSPISSLTSDVCGPMSLVVLSISAPSLP